MSNSLSIQLRQPVPLLKREVEVNGRELFKALGKAIADAASQNWNNVSLDFVDLVGALGLGETVGALAWKLVYTASARAIYKLIQDNHDLIAKNPEQLLSLSEKLVISLNQNKLVLDNDFFRNPKRSPITEALQTWFRQWLESFVQEPIQAEVMSRRLPSYFVYALHEECLEYPQVYAQLKTRLDTLFSQSIEREEGWGRYRAWLQRQVEEPMFLEAFGLKQVFVPLCAYYFREEPEKSRDDEEFSRMHRKEKEIERVVVELEAELGAWLQKADRQDAIRLISGGPGSGKSSFTKMWAATLSEAGTRVLFIPLHQFNAAGDLVEAIGSYLDNTQFLRHNPLSGDGQDTRLLLILDGLDELAMQGKVGAESAQAFVREVQTKVSQFNSLETRLQVVLSGREVVVQASSDTFRKSGQVLHVLPYFLSESEQKNYRDPNQFLAIDRRQQWWQKYGEVSGRGYTQLPDELRRENLREITAQPLLNYLVALSYVGGRLEFTEKSNLNEIYADLLTAIYERGWAERRQHPSLEGISQPQFERILEEIALSSWHGDGRTTTVVEIERHCDSSGLKQLLAIFQEGAKTGVTRLLTAFYFRQSGGNRDGEKTFEFTHKSFGEYLTAKRIVREMSRIHKKLQAKQVDPDEGWDEKEALTAWATACGASAIDEYLFRYITDEVKLHYKDEPGLVQEWQTTFCELIAYLLRKGMPMEKLDLLTYYEQNRQARNAEEALLAALNACARSTQQLSTIQWPSPQAFGNWLHRLEGQQGESVNVFALRCLDYLNLENLQLLFTDLHKASLVQAHLKGANLVGANLIQAHLEGASLERANLVGANLIQAHLEGASLEWADLDGAHLDETSLHGASLRGTRLKDITWNENTKFPNLEVLKYASNVPEALLQQLGNN